MPTLYRDEQSRHVVIGDCFRGDQGCRDKPPQNGFAAAAAVGTSVAMKSPPCKLMTLIQLR